MAKSTGNQKASSQKGLGAKKFLSLLLIAVIGTTESNVCFAVAPGTISIAQQSEPNKSEASKNDPASPTTADKGTPRAEAQATNGRTQEKPTDPPKTERQLAEERKAREAAKKRGELTFDDLKFPMEKGEEFKEEMLTKENKELDKKTWKIRGFILPTTLFSQTNIKEFVLVRDNQECCFGPGAALYDCVIVKMAPGKSINYSTRVVAVKGKLEIDTESFQYPDGGHFAVYKMTAEEVK